MLQQAVRSAATSRLREIALGVTSLNTSRGMQRAIPGVQMSSPMARNASSGSKNDKKAGKSTAATSRAGQLRKKRMSNGETALREEKLSLPQSTLGTIKNGTFVAVLRHRNSSASMTRPQMEEAFALYVIRDTGVSKANILKAMKTGMDQNPGMLTRQWRVVVRTWTELLAFWSEQDGADDGKD